MAARTRAEIEQIWSHVDSVKKLTDRVIGIGPISIGLDALLTWIPVVSPIFALGVCILLVRAGVRARASPGTLMRMLTYIGMDTATDIPDLVLMMPLGSIVDVLFPGHLMAAKALQKDIESTHWVEMSARDARASGAFDQHWAQARANGLRRVVYLHD